MLTKKVKQASAEEIRDIQLERIMERGGAAFIDS